MCCQKDSDNSCLTWHCKFDSQILALFKVLLSYIFIKYDNFLLEYHVDFWQKLLTTAEETPLANLRYYNYFHAYSGFLEHNGKHNFWVINVEQFHSFFMKYPITYIMIHDIFKIKCIKRKCQYKWFHQLLTKNDLQKDWILNTDYGHTMAKSLILCGPNSNPNFK